MKDRDELIALRERVRAATGPDWEIDGRLEVLARRLEAYAVWLTDSTRTQWRSTGSAVSDGHTNYPAARFTGTIDAALVFVERVLPGWSIRMSLSEGYRYPNVGMARSHPTNASVTVEHLTIPLAIISAALTALIEKESEHGKDQ